MSWASSADGQSADANAIYNTYVNSLTRNLGPGSLEPLKRGLISASFDGASVMMGSKNCVAALFRQLASQLL